MQTLIDEIVKQRIQIFEDRREFLDKSSLRTLKKIKQFLIDKRLRCQQVAQSTLRDSV